MIVVEIAQCWVFVSSKHRRYYWSSLPRRIGELSDIFISKEGYSQFSVFLIQIWQSCGKGDNDACVTCNRPLAHI